jgi:hypothetical protein
MPSMHVRVTGPSYKSKMPSVDRPKRDAGGRTVPCAVGPNKSLNHKKEPICQSS